METVRRDLVASRETSRFRNILPKNRVTESEDKVETTRAHGLAFTNSTQHNFIHTGHSALEGDTSERFINNHHNDLLQPFSEVDLFGNTFLPDAERDLSSVEAMPLLPVFGAQEDEGDAIQDLHNIRMNPNDSSCEDMMQLYLRENSFAISQPLWTQRESARDGGAFPLSNASGKFEVPQEYSDCISRTIDPPLLSNQPWTASSAVLGGSPDVFTTRNLSFLGQSVSISNSQPINDVSRTEDILGFFGNYANECWHSLPFENVDSNTNALGGPFENSLANGEIDDSYMFSETSTPTERLDPHLKAVLLGIPEDPGIAGRNEELPFSYNSRLNPNNDDNSIVVMQSPDTLQASETASSPTLTKVSSLQYPITIPPEQFRSTYRIEGEKQQSEEGETHSRDALNETQKSISSSSTEINPCLNKPLLRTVLPLLPPPADFSHTSIVIKGSIVQNSALVENYLNQASEAKLQGEIKLAAALSALTNLSLTTSFTSQKRARSSEEYLTDLSDNDACQTREGAEGGAETQLLNAVTSTSVFSRKKRGKLSKQQRISTATIRKLGACLRCGIYKKKCSDSMPCERCIEVARSKPATIKIPCWRSKLFEIELYRRRTQHGLFVYTYTKQLDGLQAREVRIFDPEKLKPLNFQELPFTCQHELMIEPLRPLKYLENRLFHNKNGHPSRYSCTIEQLEKGRVITKFLDMQMKPVLNALGTSHPFVRLTLDIAETYKKNPDRDMLRNSLRIFTARFLRRKFWVSTPDEISYDVAWMDVPWRAMPVLPPNTSAEAEILNKILKDYLFSLERAIIRDFRAKIYARKHEDWFELFLVTFIFQVILSEKLEMSFYSSVPGVDVVLEMPWSTFGGLRSYSSQEIAEHFRAISGSSPFRLSRVVRTKLGKLGDVENDYLDVCPKVLKDAMFKKDDIGSRRSSSCGQGGTPGSWWQWAIETIIGSESPD